MSLVSDRVFDHVPQEESFPYVAMGELIDTEFNNDDAEQMSSISITIHSYSREWGRKETHNIQERITAVLHRAALSETGFNFVTIDRTQSSSFVDVDGITRHGIVEFNIIITEA
jgi:hypothetical protein